MARIIWDRADNPARYVSDRLGIRRSELRQALHEIKRRSNLQARDRVIIYDDGTVRDEDGEELGNVFDEI
jgi:hypothetical protein